MGNALNLTATRPSSSSPPLLLNSRAADSTSAASRTADSSAGSSTRDSTRLSNGHSIPSDWARKGGGGGAAEGARWRLRRIRAGSPTITTAGAASPVDVVPSSPADASTRSEPSRRRFAPPPRPSPPPVVAFVAVKTYSNGDVPRPSSSRSDRPRCSRTNSASLCARDPWGPDPAEFAATTTPRAGSREPRRFRREGSVPPSVHPNLPPATTTRLSGLTDASTYWHTRASPNPGAAPSASARPCSTARLAALPSRRSRRAPPTTLATSPSALPWYRISVSSDAPTRSFANASSASSVANPAGPSPRPPGDFSRHRRSSQSLPTYSS